MPNNDNTPKPVSNTANIIEPDNIDNIKKININNDIIKSFKFKKFRYTNILWSLIKQINTGVTKYVYILRIDNEIHKEKIYSTLLALRLNNFLVITAKNFIESKSSTATKVLDLINIDTNLLSKEKDIIYISSKQITDFEQYLTNLFKYI